MSTPPLGYRRGYRATVEYPLDDALTVSPLALASIMTWATEAGHVKDAVSGDSFAGVSMQRHDAAAPEIDSTKVLVDMSEDSLYEFLASSTPTVAMVGTSADIGGPQTIITDVLTANNDVFIHEVYPERGTVLVSFTRTASGPVVPA